MTMQASKHSDEVWIILSVETAERPMAEYDHNRSTMESYHTMTREEFPVSGNAVYRLEAASASIDSHDILSVTTSVLFLRRRALTVFKKLAPDLVSFKSAEVHATDRVIDGFEMVKPLTVLDCIDLEASELTWLVPKRYISKIRKLRFKKDCIAGHQFAREELSQHLLISAEIKAELAAIDPDGFDARRPEDLTSLV